MVCSSLRNLELYFAFTIKYFHVYWKNVRIQLNPEKRFPGNYQPISSLSLYVKSHEEGCQWRNHNYFEKYNTICGGHYNFISKLSTGDLLSNMTLLWIRTIKRITEFRTVYFHNI